MQQGKIRFWISLVFGISVLAAIGQPVLQEMQAGKSTIFAKTMPEARVQKQPIYSNPEYQGKGASFWPIGPLVRMEGGNVSSNTFEAVLVQEMSFGGFRVGAGAAEIFLSPSGTVQTRGHIAMMDRRMRPAVFQITTDSLRLLEVRLPDVFYLHSGDGVGPLAVRPSTEYGTDRFVMELLPRPQVNMLRIGGTLTIPLAENKVRSGDFSSPFRIEFIPLY